MTLTEADKTMLHALAERTIIDRLNRAEAVGATTKGRVIVEFRGEPTEAEVAWEALGRRLRGEE